MNVVCLGLLTIDHVLTVDAVPGPDEKVVARSSTLDAGGPAANAAATASLLGSEVTLVTAVGTSALTDLAVSRLTGRGVTVVDLLADAPGMPAISTVLVTADSGDRAVVSMNATAVEAGTDVPPDLLDTAAVLLVDGHHIETAIPAAVAARRRGIPVLFDGGSWKAGTDRLLEHVDVALVSSDFSPPDGSDPLAYLTRAGCPVAARSDGPRPIVGRIDDERFEVPVDQVDVVDTLGAGDVLHGALAHFMATSYERPSSVPGLVRAAAVVAGASVRHAGARGWTDDLDDVATAARRTLEA